MRRVALLFSLVIAPAFAEVDVTKLIKGNQASPETITSIHYGQEGKVLWIFYHAPSAKGRHIFNGAGALQPEGSVWRVGADFATVLHTVDINGLAVPKGDYTLYVDLDKGKWKLIVNKQLMAPGGRRSICGINRDGSTTNNPATEPGRVDLVMGKPLAPVETLKTAFVRTGENQGKIEIAWENVTATTPFTVK